MKLKTQIAIITLGLAASTSLLWSADEPRHTGGPTIVGVWQVSRQGVNCNDPSQPLTPPFPALVTFHSDGTMTADTGPDLNTNEYGSWQRGPGSHNYSFRDVFYRFDENGTFVGSGVIAANVHLTGANSFTYRATIQISDADGNLIGTFCGRATGTRFE